MHSGIVDLNPLLIPVESIIDCDRCMLRYILASSLVLQLLSLSDGRSSHMLHILRIAFVAVNFAHRLMHRIPHRICYVPVPRHSLIKRLKTNHDQLSNNTSILGCHGTYLITLYCDQVRKNDHS